MTSEENNALRQRYELLKGAEHHKNALIEVYHYCRPSRMICNLTIIRNFYAVWISSRKIITRRGWIMLVNHTLIGMFKGERWNYKRSCANTRQLWWVRSFWLTKTSFEYSSDTLDLPQDRDAFILVLLDGDGMIFDDNFISRGENGGREAAQLLWSSVTDFVQKSHLNLPSDYKVVTRIYANLKGLGDVCQRSGIIEKPEIIEDFARGFTGSKQLFDFVDVPLPTSYGGPSLI